MLPDEIIGIIFGFLPYSVSRHLLCGNVYIDNNINETKELIIEEFDFLVDNLDYIQGEFYKATGLMHEVYFLDSIKKIGEQPANFLIGIDLLKRKSVFEYYGYNTSFRQNYVILYAAELFLEYHGYNNTKINRYLSMSDDAYIDIFNKLEKTRKLYGPK